RLTSLAHVSRAAKAEAVRVGVVGGRAAALGHCRALDAEPPGAAAHDPHAAGGGTGGLSGTDPPRVIAAAGVAALVLATSIAGTVVMGDPPPDVAAHVVEPVVVGREAGDRPGRLAPAATAAGDLHDCAAARIVDGIAPGVAMLVGSGRGVLPLGFSRQSAAA